MKIHQYNEMMRYLTRPAPDPSIKQYLQGGRIGFANGRTLKDVIGNYSVSDLRKLGIVQPMFAWGSNEPSIITAENLQTHGNQMEPHPMSDEDWERMLMGLTDQRKLKQIEDSINIYEGRSGYKPGGLVEPGVTYYARKSPTKINEETFKKIDDFIAKSEGTLSKKALGESLGYKTVEKGQAAGQGGLNKVIKAWEKDRRRTFEFKPAKFTADSPKVKQVIELFENGMSKKAIEFKTGISRKEIRNIFHQFAPEYIGDANLPSGEGKNAVKKRRLKIIKELTDYWKDKPGGKKMLEEMNQKLRDIKLKNAEIANMSDGAILKNKMFKEAMNLDVKGLKAGKGINFNRYANLTPEEYVAKVKAMAKTNEFFQPEHFIAINKNNPASMNPKNIYTAVGKMGGQMEVMKNFIASNPKDKRVSEISNLFKSQNIPVTKAPGIWKTLGKRLTGVFGPTGIVGLTTGFGFDPKSATDRMGVAAEAALAPELVKASIGATKGMKSRAAQKAVQQLLNLGLPTRTALRVARVASPLGLLYLGGEGLYKMYKEGHFEKERMMPSLMDKEAYAEAQKEKFDVSKPMFKSGGKVDYDNYLPDIDDMDY